MAWTTEQQQAIDMEGKNIIVSAGAGSGKTAVLTARVQRLLQSGIHINELLVLTFTNAAAFEMKERIRKTIKKTSGLEEELNYIDASYITTFDSFSLSIVKKYHTLLNITDNIGITDEAIINIKKEKLLDDILDEMYQNPSLELKKFLHDFCLKDDNPLREAVLSIYKKIELKYDKKEFIKNYFKEFNQDKIESFSKEYIFIILEKIKVLGSMIDSLDQYFDGDFVDKVKSNFMKLLSAKSYDEVISGLDYKSITVPRGSEEEGKKLKKQVFDFASSIKEFCIYPSFDDMIQSVFSTKDTISVLLSIIEKLDDRLDNYKLKNNIFNFTDIARLAIQIVKEHAEVQEELKNTFHEILVDEYQDTSDTQEVFISLISHDNVYMVGDIKQSIYRFRNANPYLFKSKYDTYRDTDLGIKIDLLKNFRSRMEVLDNINLLFDYIMDDTIGGADYQASHRMVFGNKTYIEEGMTNQNYNMELITYEKEQLKNCSSSEEEAYIIADDIKKKVCEKFQVFDKDELVLRDISYSDFVILLDKSRDFNLYKKVFEYFQIPLSVLKDESLKREDDILIIKNIFQFLICIKNKTFDNNFIHSFLSISRSFLFEMSDDEIYKMISDKSYFQSDLYKKCLVLVKYMDTIPLSSFYLKILDSFQYDEKLLKISNMKQNRIREEYIYNLCLNYEKMGYSIYDFNDYLEEILNGEYDLKFNISKEESNSVKIMTIHKSKGLEFPICYFAGFSSRFNMSELKERIIFDNTYGIIAPKVDYSYQDTFIKTLLKIRTRREEISEKIRLLYVAFTRAKEKVIIVCPSLVEEKEVSSVLPIYEREQYNSFFSIMKSIYSLLLPYHKESNIIADKKYLNEIKSKEIKTNNNNSLVVLENDFQSIEIEEEHFSKKHKDLISKEKMDFGIKIHEVLENIDFYDYDLESFYLSDYINKKIKSFLESDFIKKYKNYSIYKEYEFIYDEDNKNLHGIIDLMFEGNEDIIIVDYKLKNIDDIEYDKQVLGYKKYIENKTGKRTSAYLYSILDEVYREVI